MKHLSQSDALTKSNSTEEKVSKISLILTYHPLNTRVQRILLDNFKVMADDPVASLIFPQRPMVAVGRDDNLRTSLVHTRRYLSMRTPTLPYLWPYFQRNRSSGAKGSLHHQRFLHLLVLLSDLLHLLPSLPCHLHRRDWAHSEGTFC